MYEVSVRHCDIRGMPGYVTADVMLSMYVAKPLPQNKNSCSITIISQVRLWYVTIKPAIMLVTFTALYRL